MRLRPKPPPSERLPLPSERERRMEKALRLARATLAGEAQMTRDALALIDSVLKR